MNNQQEGLHWARDPNAGEDGVLINPQVLEKLKFHFYDKRAVEPGPINLFAEQPLRHAEYFARRQELSKVQPKLSRWLRFKQYLKNSIRSIELFFTKK